MRTHRVITACLALLTPTAALAHGGTPPESPGWTFDPWIVMPLVLFGTGYALGIAALWRQAGFARGVRHHHVICYAAGWLALAGALMSPLHAAGERLFTAHMLEHEVIITVAAPLLVLARPAVTFLWAWPAPLRRRLGHAATHGTVRAAWRIATLPTLATVLHAVAIWVWHMPNLLDAAVLHVTVHRLQHLSFLLTALLFWWAVLRRCGAGAAVGHLFITMTHTGLLGALLTFAPRVIYGVQTSAAAEWGLTGLEDQQLAGLVMWVPGGIIYAAAALALAAKMIRRSSVAWKPDSVPQHR